MPDCQQISLHNTTTQQQQTMKNKMKTITLQEACNLIENSSALIIDNDIRPLMYPSLWIEDEVDEEFMYLEYEYNFCEYVLKFKRSENQNVKVSGTSMFLIDTEAENENDHTKITLLAPMNLES